MNETKDLREKTIYKRIIKTKKRDNPKLSFINKKRQISQVSEIF
jgi:hypothetical protein